MPSSPDDSPSFHRRVIRLSGHRHAYACVEPEAPTAPPVLAVHGFGTSGYRTFRHVADQFARAGIPLYAIDLLGFGESDVVDATYSLSLYGRLLRDFADAVALERPVLMGHSMGGKVATAAAVDFPERFGGLMLVNSGGFAPVERMLPFIARSWWARQLLAQDWFYHRVLPLTALGPILQTEESRAQLRMLRNSHSELDLKRTGYLKRLPELHLPALILWGARDRVLPRSTPYRMQRYLPHAHLRLIPDAGHAPMKDQPQVFVQALAPFVRELVR